MKANLLNWNGQTAPKGTEELLPLVYEELRRLAASKMALEKPGQTLGPTALVHEVWLRLACEEKQSWNGRTQFMSAAAEAMRRILIDNARRKRARRHGGGLDRMDVDDPGLEIAAPAAAEDAFLAPLSVGTHTLHVGGSFDDLGLTAGQRFPAISSKTLPPPPCVSMNFRHTSMSPEGLC